MPTTTSQKTLLRQLRQLMPSRPLSQTDAKRIAELQANRLLRACGVIEPGTPSEIITSFSNIKVTQRSDLPTSGWTDWFKPHWLIFVNANEPQVRQRFSLFHELKHVLDHPVIDGAYPPTNPHSAEQRAELICDYFAACVLMPKRFVRSAFFQGQRDPIELAAMFGVSPAAMTWRLQELGLIERANRHAPSTQQVSWRPFKRTDSEDNRRPFFRTSSAPPLLKEVA